jgi:cell division protease FtsH
MRKLKIFIRNNKIWFIVIPIIAIIVLLSIWLFSRVDSYYRNILLAPMPAQLGLAGVSAVIFVLMYASFLMGGRMTGAKKSKIEADRIKVTFSDVIGLEGAKKEALEIVQIIKDRAQLKKIGGKIIRGLLLMGPPGTGKTLLAKAIATESGIPFLSMAGSEFVEIFVGVGAGRVRSLFKKAREYAYTDGACIVFIDEIDVIGRGRAFSSMGSQEADSTQNQLLAEMDGLDSKSSNVIVIAATNASESVLDKALLRPGRFDRKIYINLPNGKDRENLYKFYMQKINYDESIDISRLARRSVGKSPADIENIVKESALIATRKQKTVVALDDIMEAMDRVDLGLETHLELSREELEWTAYHEAGHAVALYMLHPTDDVFKATIKSRGDALGLVAHQPLNELHTINREKLYADIIVSLAGYTAEKIKYATTSTGVSSDFTKAMRIAHTMVWRVGMGPGNLVGDFTAIPDAELSGNIKERLNNETMMIMNACLKAVEEFLRKEWQVVEAIAGALLEKQELDYDAVESIFNSLQKPKSVDSKALSQYLKSFGISPESKLPPVE